MKLRNLISTATALGSVLVAVPISAEVFSDNFNDNSRDATIWAADVAGNNGVFNEINGRLEYSVSSPDPDYDEAYRPWLAEVPSDTDWVMTLNVNSSHVPSSGANYSIGFGLANADKSEVVYIEQFTERSGGSTFNGFLSALDGEDDIFGEELSPDLNITSGSIKMAFNAATKVVTTSYDRDGAGAAFDWEFLGSFGIAGTGGATANRNWNIAPGERIYMSLSAFSEGTAIPAGTVWSDDFNLVIDGGAAPSVELVIVEKEISYLQTSPTTTVLRTEIPGEPDYGGPFGFSVNVEGPDLESITPPRVTVPAGAGITGPNYAAWFDDGRLHWDGDGSWSLGINADNWGSPSLTERDALFPNGIYTVNVLNQNIALNLTGDAQPPAPMATLSGGTWESGVYLVPASQSISITLAAPPGWGAHEDDRFSIEIDESNDKVERFHSQSASTAPLVKTLPAFSPGQIQYVWLAYNAVVDTAEVLPDALQGAVYSAYSMIKIASPPTLRIERVGNQWQVIWAGGVLEKANNLTGSWDPINTPSPLILTLTPNQPPEFYRVRADE